MWITRISVLGSLLIGAALPVQATGDGTDKSLAGPISAEAMAKVRELRPGEYFAKTREGCSIIIDEPHASRKEAFTAAWARFTWEGVCSEGMALGPGKFISRTENGETVSIIEGWQLYGRWIGLSVVTYLYPGASGSKTEIFYWDGEGYARNVVRPEPLEARKEHMPSVSYVARDRSQRVTYSLLGRCGTNAQPCVSEWKHPYPPVADSSAGRTELYCNGSCGNLWVEKAGPIITAFDSFAKAHAADVAAVKQALEPILVQRRREAVEAEAQARRDAAEAEVQAKRKAAQAELVAQAEAQRKREEAVRAEQQFRTSLQTMNPGQLFAKADELSAQGDGARAREVQRALMSRFPNHPLAATAARQMAGESSTSSAATSSNAASAAGTRPTVATRGEPSVEMLMSRCSETLKTTIDVEYREEIVRDRYFRRNHTGSRERTQRSTTQAATEYATGALAIPPNSLAAYHAGALQEAEIRIKPMQNGLHDTHREQALLRACLIKARIDSGAVTAGPVALGRLSGAQCQAMKQSVMTTRVPPNASVTASTETVMFMTKTVLDMIAGGCPTDSSTPAQVEAERQERQRQYTAAESACNVVQSGGRRCVPRVHTAAEVSRPAVSSAAQNTQQQGAISYDPVTGRCLGEGCCSLPGITGQPQCSDSSRPSGGGIRTAR